MTSKKTPKNSIPNNSRDNNENTQHRGIFHNYGDLLSFFKHKSTELRGCGCGIMLDNNNIYLQFVDPATGKRKKTPTGIKLNNDEAVIIACSKARQVGEKFFGASTKTDGSPVMLVPSPALIEELHIRQPKLPEYHPEPGSKPKIIVNGFDKAFSHAMLLTKCPVTQLDAFRRLHNDLLKMYGISTSVRSRNLGHTDSTNTRYYDTTGENFKNDVEFLENIKIQALPYEAAIFELQRLGIDTESPETKIELKTILKIIYQLED